MIYTPEALDIMARTLYGEVRGETWEGKVAVAWVIRHRVDRPGWWGNDIISVCRAKQQFSCWNKNDPNLPKLTSVTIAHPAFRECLAATAAVLSNNIPDPIKGSTHYHTRGVIPIWSKGLIPVKEIGSHLFFNNVP